MTGSTRGWVAALLGTVLLGVWMRWALAGAVSLPVPLAHLRHAHSHLGYFGLLFPLAWLGWRELGADVPGPRTLVAYGIATVVAVLGFLRAGYGPEAIAGSTAVAAVWLWSGWRNRERLARLHDPLGMVLPGVVLSVACVPPIAFYLRRDPPLAAGLVSTFLTLLLLGVVVPSAAAVHRYRIGPWPGLLAAAGLSALALGVAPAPATRLGLIAYGFAVGSLAARPLAVHHRAAWGALGLGVVLMGLDLLPNHRPVAIGAIHFAILGPVLSSLVEPRLRRPPPAWGWLVGLAAVGLMSGSLVLQGLGIGGNATLTGAAVGGTAVAAWWGAVLLAQAR